MPSAPWWVVGATGRVLGCGAAAGLWQLLVTQVQVTRSVAIPVGFARIK